MSLRGTDKIVTSPNILVVRMREKSMVAEVLEVDTSNNGRPDFDVNPALCHTKREVALLKKHIRVFAINPKWPNELRTTSHRITLLYDRPVKRVTQHRN